jgi:hypothetical protein
VIVEKASRKSRNCLLMALILLSQIVLLPFSASEAKADTKVTITLAAGGVACGVFLFLRFTFRASLVQQHQEDVNALFNIGARGWNIQFPSINLTQDEEGKMFRSENSRQTAQVNLLTFKF